MKYEICERQFIPIPEEEDEVEIHRLQFNRKYWSIERKFVDAVQADFLHDIRLSYREASFRLDWTSSIELEGGNIRFQFYSAKVSEYEYLSPDEKGIRTDSFSDIRIIREYIVPLRQEDLPLARFIVQRAERENDYYEVFGLCFVLPRKTSGFVNIPLHLLEGQWPELATLTLPYEPKFISIYGLEQGEDGVFRVQYKHREDEFKKEIRRYVREHKERFQRVVVEGEEFVFPVFERRYREYYADVNGTAFPVKKQNDVYVLDGDSRRGLPCPVEEICRYR